MKHALIKNGEIKNVILADDKFVVQIQKDWDAIVPVESLSEGTYSDPKEFCFPKKVEVVPQPNPRKDKKDALLLKLNSLPDGPQKEVLQGLLELLN